MMRIILSIIAAAFVTAGLLFLMSLFIQDEQLKVKPISPPVEIDHVTLPEEKPEPMKTVEPPPQPPVIEPAPASDGLVIEDVDTDSLAEVFTSIGPEMINPDELPIGIGPQELDMTQDASAMALYRSQPNYPTDALVKGLEGWVLLKYDVDTSGALSNISVIDAEPRRVFDREAINALKKWKFKPAVTNGQPIASAAQTVKIEFNMDQE